MTDGGDRLRLRLDVAVPRSPSLGPFATARDALKFLAYAAVGAVVASVVSPWAWLPFLTVGFVVGARRPDGAAVDRRVTEFLGWKLRCRGGRGGRATRCHRTVRDDRSVADLGSGVGVAVVRAEGVPVAFLPPASARELYASYRQLLGSIEGGLGVLVRGRPIGTRSFVPSEPSGRTGEDAAQRGYAEMIQLLGRHRRRREVLVAVGGSSGSAAAWGLVERRLTDLQERLGAMGIRSERLRGAALSEGLSAFGWARQRAG